MNILTFDIEEWYIEKISGGRDWRYRQFDDAFARLLDVLDEHNIKATFFCVGRMAIDFPDVIKKITDRGHEVGCHSHRHIWINKMDEAALRSDTIEALKSIEDVYGQKVVSYRAPAFSLTEQNKWAIGVLVDCGIKYDSSIFPAARDLGGYPAFPQDTPCIIDYQGASMKEFPISLANFCGKRMAYSGGGYFRLLPYWITNKTIKRKGYNMCYFHLFDIIHEELKFLSRKEYESYFKEPGSLKNRVVRYLKSNVGTGDAFSKMVRLFGDHPFVNIHKADDIIDWKLVNKITL